MSTRPGIDASSTYARRAAEKYLSAYERQDGRAYATGCGMTFGRSMLAKVAGAYDGLEPVRGEWWGDTARRAAEKILAQLA